MLAKVFPPFFQSDAYLCCVFSALLVRISLNASRGIIFVTSIIIELEENLWWLAKAYFSRLHKLHYLPMASSQHTRAPLLSGQMKRSLSVVLVLILHWFCLFVVCFCYSKTVGVTFCCCGVTWSIPQCQMGRKLGWGWWKENCFQKKRQGWKCWN